jgi:hypothetical protein
MSWKVIGNVYDKYGDLYGKIIGLSGDTITVELQGGTDIVSEMKFTTHSLVQAGYRIEWVNVKPVFYGEF